MSDFIFKIYLIPYEEYEHCPDFTAVILFAFFVFVKQFYKEFGIKEMGGYRTCETFLDEVIILVFFKPYTNRNRETKLFL